MPLLKVAYTPEEGELLADLPYSPTYLEDFAAMKNKDSAKLQESAYHFSVSTCPCRQRKKLDPDSPDCQYPDPDGSYEVCLHFDRLSEYIVASGLGREITRERGSGVRS